MKKNPKIHGDLTISHGTEMYYDWSIKKYRLESNDEIINGDIDKLPCAKCGQVPTLEGYDACLGHLRGVLFACCGHGRKGERYVMFENRSVIRGDDINLEKYKK